MSLPPLDPVPNTRLVDDPARDAVWRRYLEQLINRVIPLDVGSVTSINVSSVASGLTFTGGPVSTAGTILMSGILNVSSGGSGTSTLTGYLIGNGTSAFTATTAIHVSSVTGVLPVPNGGTAISTYVIGDLIYADTTSTLAKLADVAVNNALISGGVSTAPSWGKINVSSYANDYTVTTFTPTLAGSVSSGTQGYSVQSGLSAKIGRLVIAQVRIDLTSKDATTNGNLFIEGLPYTCNSTISAGINIGSQNQFDINTAGGFAYMGGLLVANTNHILLTEMGDNVNAVALTAADFNASSSIICTAMYVST